DKTHPYEAEAAITFLDAAGGAEAEAQAARIGELVKDQKLVGHQPEGYASNEVHRAYDYAKRPDSLARRWFSDAEMDAPLDELEALQADDGGWHPNWLIWTPATGPEWTGVVTLRVLRMLALYGRI